MRILIVSAFPPDRAPEANHALHIAEHLADDGHPVDVLCKEGSIPGTRPGIAVHAVMRNWSWTDLPRLVRTVRKNRPDIVLLLYIGWVYHHRRMITFLPTICRVVGGVPCVTQFENVDTPPRGKWAITRLMRRVAMLAAGSVDVHLTFGTLLRDSAAIVALSSPHRDWLVAHNIAVAEKSVIIPPPPLIRVCPDSAIARRKAREAIGAADSDFVLLYWGYVYPGKGVETLLHAFQIASLRDARLRLLLVGGSLDVQIGPIWGQDYFRMVRALSDRLDIAGKVTWTGHFDWDSDVGSQYLYAADACVLPIDFGVTLNNSSLAAASTHGVPVIATEVPGGRDEALEHGRNVYLVPPRNPDGLAEAIELMSQDPALRARLRAGICRLARDWHSWDRTIRRLVETFAAAKGAPGSVLPAQIVHASEHNRAQSIGSPAGPSAPLPDHHPFENSIDLPAVSVVVAAYNVEKYLVQCLDSLVHQTLKNIEIIVVNDASTDDTPAIARTYATRYRNVHVVDCVKQVGLASVRNTGMRHARGTYIGFVDGDDWAHPRKYELMYLRAERDTAEVVFAGIRPFVEDTKVFVQGNDQHLWNALAADVKAKVFAAREHPSVFVMEPAVWAKLYKQSFLQQHGLEFESGMNSVEDVIFHFAVLCKAERVALLDEPLSFYRINRPGQITGRTDRRIFETFTVFEKTSEAVARCNASDEIWAALLSTKLRFFHWLLRDRVPARFRREFFAQCAVQLQRVPESAFRMLAARSKPHDLAQLFYMRRKQLRYYDNLVRWPFLVVLPLLPYGNRLHVRLGVQDVKRRLRHRMVPAMSTFVNGLFGLSALQHQLRSVQESVKHLAALSARTGEGDEGLIQVCRIGNQKLFLSDWSPGRGLRNAVWRMESDYYLTQNVTFRQGDVVVDVGAHVGVMSIYLARTFPFIKVYAVEPDPRNFACLVRNAELNGVKNLTLINKAVTGDGRNATLYVDPSDGAWATVNPAAASSKRTLRSVPVESVSLDQLFRDHEIHQCRVLKVTALGAVHEILHGKTGKGCVDLLCGEVDLRDCGRTPLEAASWRLSRQHFWRTTGHQPAGAARWLHQQPTEIEAGSIVGSDPALTISDTTLTIPPEMS